MADTTDTTATPREASRYASRKFLLATAGLIATNALLLHGKIDAATWLEATRWTLGLYFGANVATWAADLLKGRAS